MRRIFVKHTMRPSPGDEFEYSRSFSVHFHDWRHARTVSVNDLAKNWKNVD